jgi:Skp family chaperone for outer membrane proteins
MLNTNEAGRPDEQCLMVYVSEFIPAFAAVYDGAAAAAARRAELDAMRRDMAARAAQREAELAALRAAHNAQQQQTAAEREQRNAAAAQQLAAARQQHARRRDDELARIARDAATQQRIVEDNISLLRDEVDAKVILPAPIAAAR